MFDKAVADARPVRAAALAGDTDKAMRLAHGVVATDLAKAREAAIDLVDELRKAVDQQSEELSATHEPRYRNYVDRHPEWIGNVVDDCLSYHPKRCCRGTIGHSS